MVRKSNNSLVSLAFLSSRCILDFDYVSGYMPNQLFLRKLVYINVFTVQVLELLLSNIVLPPSGNKSLGFHYIRMYLQAKTRRDTCSACLS
jgi:hypothetical protein